MKNVHGEWWFGNMPRPRGDISGQGGGGISELISIFVNLCIILFIA